MSSLSFRKRKKKKEKNSILKCLALRTGSNFVARCKRGLEEGGREEG